jgi:DNA-binding NtrC family response regulator
MVVLPGFQEDPEWIARHTEPPITVEQAREALEVGLRLGYIERKGGRLVSTADTRRTSVKVSRMGSWAYHRDGLELAAELRQINPRLPVAVISANHQQQIVNRARAVGATFLPKPLVEQALKEFLQSAVRELEAHR